MFAGSPLPVQFSAKKRTSKKPAASSNQPVASTISPTGQDALMRLVSQQPLKIEFYRFFQVAPQNKDIKHLQALYAAINTPGTGNNIRKLDDAACKAWLEGQATGSKALFQKLDKRLSEAEAESKAIADLIKLLDRAVPNPLESGSR